ncbi:MAG: carboxypeptidase regulatory-like domain-containing protein [Planctomycetota bacterium]
MTRRTIIAAGLSILLTLTAAQAFVSLRTDGGAPLRWHESTITVTLSTELDPAIADGSDEAAARAALATWEQASEGGLRLVTDDAPAARARSDWQSDDLHLVWWDPADQSGLFPAGSGLIAMTPVDFDPRTGRILDADVIVDGRQRFSTRGATDAYDLQAVLTHELGHLLGLDHSPLGGQTMSPVPLRGGDGGQASLAPDELAALRALYPGASATGALSGVVRRGDGSPVIGAHVVAEDERGQPASSTLSDAAGGFSLAGLPPGDYVVYAEPLLDASQLDARTRRGLQTDFGTTFWGPGGRSSALSPARARAQAGATVSLGELSARAAGPLARVALDPILLHPGEQARVRAQGSGLKGSLRIVVSGPLGAEPRVADPIVGLGVATFTLEAPSWARAQLHALRIVNPDTGDAWVRGGALEVRDLGPRLLEVSPRQARPGERLTLRGERLGPGASALVGGALVPLSGGGDRAELVMPALPSGVWDLSVIAADGQRSSLLRSLEVPSDGAPGAAAAGATGAPTSGGAASAPAPSAPGVAAAPPSSGGGGGCSLSSTDTVGAPAGALLILLVCLSLALRRDPSLG